MGAVRAKVKSLPEELDDVLEKLSDLHERAVAEVEYLTEALEEKIPGVGDDHVTELARIRTCLKAGRCDAGRERLERVLDDLDGAWRTRA